MLLGSSMHLYLNLKSKFCMKTVKTSCYVASDLGLNLPMLHKRKSG